METERAHCAGRAERGERRARAVAADGAPRFERPGERGLVHGVAACGVDDDGARDEQLRPFAEEGVRVVVAAT